MQGLLRELEDTAKSSGLFQRLHYDTYQYSKMAKTPLPSASIIEMVERLAYMKDLLQRIEKEVAISVDYPMNQDDILNLLSTTREVINYNRVLCELDAKGVMKRF